jgi:hypothetical protein
MPGLEALAGRLMGVCLLCSLIPSRIRGFTGLTGFSGVCTGLKSNNLPAPPEGKELTSHPQWPVKTVQMFPQVQVYSSVLSNEGSDLRRISLLDLWGILPHGLRHTGNVGHLWLIHSGEWNWRTFNSLARLWSQPLEFLPLASSTWSN